ncbi:hypothetical protein V6N13_025197 [Hibiscus sabdariffa]
MPCKPTPLTTFFESPLTTEAYETDCEFHTFFAILCYSQRGEAGLPKTWCGATSVIRPLFDGIEVKFDGGILAGIREEKRSR